MDHTNLYRRRRTEFGLTRHHKYFAIVLLVLNVSQILPCCPRPPTHILLDLGIDRLYLPKRNVLFLRRKASRFHRAPINTKRANCGGNKKPKMHIIKRRILHLYRGHETRHSPNNGTNGTTQSGSRLPNSWFPNLSSSSAQKYRHHPRAPNPQSRLSLGFLALLAMLATTMRATRGSAAGCAQQLRALVILHRSQV